MINLSNEKMILISIIGALESIKGGGLSIDDAERMLFSPRIICQLKGENCNLGIINILEKGCELEDIASLIPQDLIQSINEMQQEALEELKKLKY